MTEAAVTTEPKRGSWRQLAFALAAFLLLPLIPILRSIVPIEQTLLLIVPGVAICALLGWKLGGRAALAGRPRGDAGLERLVLQQMKTQVQPDRPIGPARFAAAVARPLHARQRPPPRAVLRDPLPQRAARVFGRRVPAPGPPVARRRFPAGPGRPAPGPPKSCSFFQRPPPTSRGTRPSALAALTARTVRTVGGKSASKNKLRSSACASRRRRGSSQERCR